VILTRLLPLTLLAALGCADAPRPAQALRFAAGIDTLPPRAWGESEWKAPVAAIVRAWNAYRDERVAANGQWPTHRTAMWSLAEQEARPIYDLTFAVDAPGLRAILLDVRPTVVGDTSEFMLRVLYTDPGGAGGDSVTPYAITRTYAVREGGRWVLSAALPRLTRDWERQQVGPIQYVVQPGHRFDRTRAETAVAFADSLADAFGVPRLDSLTYYLTDSPTEMYRIMGVDWNPVAPSGAGQVFPPNHQLFSGDPRFGEAHRHELTHAVLEPLSAHAHGLVTEGLATWLGGTIGASPAATLHLYAGYLRAHPKVTLDSLFASSYDVGYRPGGAILCELVYANGGVPALKALLHAGAKDSVLRVALDSLLGAPNHPATWADVAARWRRAALAH